MFDPQIAATSPLATSIDLGEPEDVRRWTARFGVTEAQLRIAIADVGDAPAQVGEHLGMPAARDA